jgi:DNA-directed RNA polymerase subunit RPC12/RpoP
MYGVVVCSRCRKARAVDLRTKTVRCQCGNQIDLKESKKFFESHNQKEIASAVGRINAEIGGGIEEWEKLVDDTSGEESGDIYSKIVSDAADTPVVQDRLEMVARNLTDAFGRFTRKEMEKALRMLGMKDVEDRIQALLQENIIYEPEPGVFCAV